MTLKIMETWDLVPYFEQQLNYQLTSYIRRKSPYTFSLNAYLKFASSNDFTSPHAFSMLGGFLPWA